MPEVLSEKQKEELKRREYYTVGELAEILQVPTRIIHKLIKDGELKCFYIGSAKRISYSMLQEYIDSHQRKPR